MKNNISSLLFLLMLFLAGCKTKESPKPQTMVKTINRDSTSSEITQANKDFIITFRKLPETGIG
jgi:hypothetical protein